MKKLMACLLAAVLCISTTACNTTGQDNSASGSETPSSNAPEKESSSEPVSSAEPVEPLTNKDGAVEIDGIEYTMWGGLPSIEGNFHKEASSSREDSYFEFGGELLKVTEYMYVEAHVTIKNNTDKPFGYSFAFSDAKLQNGQKLLPQNSHPDLFLQEIPPHFSADIVLQYPVKQGPEPADVTVNFAHMNYDQAFWDDYAKMERGELSKEDMTAKYQSKATPVSLTSPLAG